MYSESVSYITTDAQSVSLSWNKSPVWGLRPDLFTIRQLRVCRCGVLSLTRGRVCRLQLLLALARAVIFESVFHGTRDHILFSEIRDFPFRRLLRLAGLRWRYSTPPPHGSDLNSRINSLFIAFREQCRSLYVGKVILLCYSPVATGISLILW
jgi:hypothetical protein